MIPATLRTPLTALLLGGGGALLAWLWYSVAPWAPIVVVGGLTVTAVVVQKVGERTVAANPKRGLALMETRVFSIGALTALAGAVAIVVAVQLAAPEGATESTKQILTTLSTALVGFVSALVISADDVDNAVGDYVKSHFQRVYVGGDAPQAEKWFSCAARSPIEPFRRRWTSA